MEIKVDVSQISGIDLSTVVGERLVYDYDEERNIPYAVTLGDIVATKLVDEIVKDDQYPSLRKQALDIRDELIKAAIEPQIGAALTKPLQQTNTFGEPTGPATTMRELILAEVGKVLSLRRDSQGYANKNAPTVIEKLITTEVNAVFTKEVKEAIEAEKKKITDALRKHAAAVLAKTIEDSAAVIKSVTTPTISDK